MKALTIMLAGALLVPVAARAETEDGCVACHKDEKLKILNKKLYDYYREWDGAPHQVAGVSCRDCHGGNAQTRNPAEAHEGIRSQSDPASPLHYKNIPQTCGACHSEVHAQFVKSKHYKILQATGEAPNCVTCHGSMNAKTYYHSILTSACSTCHNSETKNHPEIVPQAKKIIERLNHAEGYRKWAEFYYDAIGKPEEMRRVDPLYEKITHAWHGFDFQKLDAMSADLLAELKDLFNSLKKERDSKK